MFIVTLFSHRKKESVAFYLLYSFRCFYLALTLAFFPCTHVLALMQLGAIDILSL